VIIAIAFLMAQSGAAAQVGRTGEEIFAQNCAVGYCHGAAGAAGRGPRLRGRSFDEGYVRRVVRDGIPRSAMPAWKDRLSETDLAAVVRYVLSLSTESATPKTTQPAMDRAAPEAAIPADVAPGRALFFDATRETPCGTCHELGNRGIPVGPDLSKIGTKTESEMKRLIEANRPTRVDTIRTASGERFAGLVVSEDARLIRIYDLTAALPVLRTFERSQVLSRERSTSWNHAAYAAGLSDSQIADIIAWLRSDFRTRI
jgi:putative heme-binding domain-containing protein